MREAEPDPPDSGAGGPRHFYFDTVTLSNFALVGRLGLLTGRYGNRALITSEVRNEVVEGVVAGYEALQAIEAALENGELGSAATRTGDERPIYQELLQVLGPGEASCIAGAAVRGGTVVTDDRRARECAAEREIPVTGTIGILRACVRDGALEADEADAVLQSMIDAGYYAPVRRISDLS